MPVMERMSVRGTRVGSEYDKRASHSQYDYGGTWKVTNMDDAFEPDQGYFDWENAYWCARFEVFPLGTVLVNVKTGVRAVVSKGYGGHQLKKIRR